MFRRKMSFAVILVVLLLFAGSQAVFSAGTQEQADTEGGIPGEITFVIPYSAGGGTDQTGRLIARHLEDVTGSNIIVVNKDGAGGAFGMEEIIKSEADGKTIGLVPYPALVMSLERTAYTPEDFSYLASFTQTPPSLMVAPDSNFETLEDLIEYAKKNPGKVVASESGDSLLLTAILFQDQAGIDMTTVNYDGAGDSLTALLGGHVDAAFISAQFIENARSEGAKALAISNSERLEDLSDIPTFLELGYDVVTPISRIVVAPQGIPAAVRSAIVDALIEAADRDELRKSLRAGGEVPKTLGDQESTDFVLTGAKTIKRLQQMHSEKFARD